MLNKEYYITIDCPPGNIRPDNILTNVLVNTKLNSNNFTVKCKSFGEWTARNSCRIIRKYSYY